MRSPYHAMTLTGRPPLRRVVATRPQSFETAGEVSKGGVHGFVVYRHDSAHEGDRLARLEIEGHRSRWYRREG